MMMIIILFILGNNYKLKLSHKIKTCITESKIKKWQNKKKHKPFDILNGSIPRATILITE